MVCCRSGVGSHSTKICCACGVGRSFDIDLLCSWCWEVSRQRFVVFVFVALRVVSTEICCVCGVGRRLDKALLCLWCLDVSRLKLIVLVVDLL